MTPTAKFTRLTDRALLRVGGPDWRGFLQGLITQDVDRLREGELRFGALLTPQGRLLYDLFLLGRGEDCLIDVAAGARDALVQRLTLYRLRAKVEIGPVDAPVLALWDAEAPSAPWTPDPRLAALGWRALGEAAPPEGAEQVGLETYHAHRLALGVPDASRDCPEDKTYPLEANFDLLNGVDFKKGCFVGQETTSRMKRRSSLRSRMAPIVFDGPPPHFGSEILAGTLRAGEVLSGTEGRAMALVRLDRLGAGPLSVAGRAVQVELPSWIPEFTAVEG
jgi:tRNA-modifying protein YgfZ